MATFTGWETFLISFGGGLGIGSGVILTQWLLNRKKDAKKIEIVIDRDNQIEIVERKTIRPTSTKTQTKYE